MSESSVIIRRDGRAGRLLLNRPRALNALNREMVAALRAALGEWRDDPAIHIVLIEGAGGRAFCAGADVRAAREAVLAGRNEEAEDFFAAEYALDGEIAAYPKPIIALVDGICMGGGVGLATHARFCATSEAGLFAMPETTIAFFPDVGTTWKLPRLPGAIGFYLALTGARLAGAEAVHGGLATHFVPREAMAGLAGALCRDGAAALAGFAAPLPPFALAEHRAAIECCFGQDTVTAILAALGAEDSDWARATLAALRAASPSAVCWAFAALKRGAGQTLPQALAAETAMARTVTRHPDFAEGVRAQVVDKDRTPHWSPARIEEVSPAGTARILGEPPVLDMTTR